MILFVGAKMMYYLDQTQKEKALSLATQIPGEILGTQHEVPWLISQVCFGWRHAMFFIWFRFVSGLWRSVAVLARRRCVRKMRAGGHRFIQGLLAPALPSQSCLQKPRVEQLDGEELTEAVRAALNAWRQNNPTPQATLSDVADHIDHIKAKRHGGTDDMANPQLLCSRCHGIKTRDEGRDDKMAGKGGRGDEKC